MSPFVPAQYIANVPRILQAAHRAGWSDRLIAQALGDVTRRISVWKWRTGVVHPSDPAQLAAWLGVSLKDLLYTEIKAPIFPAPPSTTVKNHPAKGRRKGNAGEPGEHGAEWIRAGQA